jgi:hypothetical protein
MTEPVSKVATDLRRRHDVAFSFLQRDEQVALRFAAAVAPLTPIVYSKKQEQLAGTDGMESLRVAFSNDSRLNVILLRTAWGTTKWTRVEETAIHDRCFEEGFDSLLIVRLDGTTPPKWCTDTRIYFDLDTFSFEEAVGAIKRQATQLGSNIRPLTAWRRLNARQPRLYMTGKPENSLEAAVEFKPPMQMSRQSWMPWNAV